ncbi:MAG: four helix bundle protein [Melioribacteraceae bacterium]
MVEKTIYFDHEKLIVYQKSLEFLKWLNVVLSKVEKRYAVYDQLDRASTSIILNISEGYGKFTSKDRCKYFDISRGSALECSAGLDILVAKNILTFEEIKVGKELLKEIVSMLVGLIKSNSERIHEPEIEYNS